MVDYANGYAHFATDTSPGIIAEVDINPTHRFQEVSPAIVFHLGENVPTSAVIDPVNGFAYFGTDTSPGRIAKVALDGKCGSAMAGIHPFPAHPRMLTPCLEVILKPFQNDKHHQER